VANKFARTVEYFMTCFSMICVAFVCYVVLLCLGSSEGLYSGNQVVVEGEAFNITCQTDVFAFIKWQKDSRPIVGALLEQYNVTEYRRGDTVTSSISSSYAQTSQSGSYRCSTFLENSYHLYVLSGKSYMLMFC
jgi:hypothetical protein